MYSKINHIYGMRDVNVKKWPCECTILQTWTCPSIISFFVGDLVGSMTCVLKYKIGLVYLVCKLVKSWNKRLAVAMNEVKLKCTETAIFPPQITLKYRK